MTKVVNIRDRVAWDVYIGRERHFGGGKFGNPFIIGKDGTRDDVIEKFKVWFQKRIISDPEFKAEVLKLKDKTLACYCAPLPCHGDVYARWLDTGCF